MRRARIVVSASSLPPRLLQNVQTQTKSHLSPRQLAHAVGVSESSIKRWADEGRIASDRTAGGHRRIGVEEALRFVRDAQLDLLRPDVLGLSGLEPVRAGSYIDHAARIRDLLLSGDAVQFRAALLSAYLAGESIAALCDGPLKEAMVAVGERWHDESSGIFEEHRATALACTGLVQLTLTLPQQQRARVALGGALRDDHSHLASLMAATVLAAAGYRQVNLGANTPAVAFLDACDAYSPALVWLSVNHVPDVSVARSEVDLIVRELHRRAIAVVIGGRAIGDLGRLDQPGLQVARTMGELSSFALGLGSVRARPD
jgi:excisionase family DNA binding protein